MNTKLLVRLSICCLVFFFLLCGMCLYFSIAGIIRSNAVCLLDQNNRLVSTQCCICDNRICQMDERGYYSTFDHDFCLGAQNETIAAGVFAAVCAIFFMGIAVNLVVKLKRELPEAEVSYNFQRTTNRDSNRDTLGYSPRSTTRNTVGYSPSSTGDSISFSIPTPEPYIVPATLRPRPTSLQVPDINTLSTRNRPLSLQVPTSYNQTSRASTLRPTSTPSVAAYQVRGLLVKYKGEFEFTITDDLPSTTTGTQLIANINEAVDQDVITSVQCVATGRTISASDTLADHNIHDKDAVLAQS